MYGNISATRQRILRFLNWVAVLLAVSLFLQLAGCFSPGWKYTKFPWTPIAVHSGLWYVLMCSNDSCETESIVIGEIPDSGLREYRGETICGIIFGIAAIVAVRICRTRLYTPNSNNVLLPIIVTGVFILLSGILATTAAGKMGDNTRKSAEYFTSSLGESPYRFPYSLFMTGVGGVIGLIGFLLLLASQPLHLQAETQPTQQQAQQLGVYPAQMMPMQTAYPPGQPQMYAIATAPPLTQTDKSQAPPPYY